MRIGITGQSGFIGTHLYNVLNFSPQKYELIEFDDSYFEDLYELNRFANDCDVIVHLAAVNRHEDQTELYRLNVELTVKLIKALNNSVGQKHVLFSSSIQEQYNNPYGNAKAYCRDLLEIWAKETGNTFTGMIIPNVFGPFGRPFYNSFIATFAHQLTRDQLPTIQIDSEVSLIYISDLVDEMIRLIDETKEGTVSIEARKVEKVSNVLDRLINFKNLYLDNGHIPKFNDKFDLQLFNVFRSYIEIENFFPFFYKINEDNRGRFIETMRLGTGGQVSYSTTHPGITRGNHFHTRKIERFAVIKGKARISLRKLGSKDVHEFFIDATKPAFVDMPIWYTHSITNVGDEELITLFWINEPYDPADPDTFFQEV